MVKALKKSLLFCCLTAALIPMGLDAWGKAKQKMHRESRYKINFQKVKAEEFIQFLSEIGGINFVFTPEELNFTINLVSDEEMTIDTIVSGFIQTLRIQGFNILEEDGTLIIHRNPGVKDLPKVITAFQDEQDVVSPIITKIYQVKNSSVDTIKNLLTPFMSTTSVVETYPDKRLLIVSDVVQNIQSIDSLVKTLDQPSTGIANFTYNTTFFSPQELVTIATPIIDSVCGGKSYSLVPQNDTQRIFIVASDSFSDKIVKIFEQVEEQAKINPSSITNSNILLYKVSNRSIQSIAAALRAVAKDSKKTDYDSQGFIKIVNGMSLIPPDFILFIGEPVELKKIDALIKTIDTPLQVKSDLTFSIVKLQYANGKTVIDQIRSMANDIPDDTENGDFLNALETIRWNKDANTIIIQGTPHTIQEITGLINKIDVQPPSTTGAAQGFNVVKLENVSGKIVLEQLNQMANDLPQTADNSDFIQCVKSIQWNKASNTLTVRGTKEAIQQVNEIVSKLDIHTVSSNQYTIYTPNSVNAQDLIKSLNGIASDLEHSSSADPGLIQTIKGIKIVKNSNSIIISGSESNIQKVKEMISKIDSPASGQQSFNVIKLQNVSGKYVIEQLTQMTNDLPTTPDNQDFLNAVTTLQWNKSNNTITVRGNAQTITQISEIISKLDVHTVSNMQYIIYKPTNMTAAELLKALQGIGNDLEHAGTADPALLQTIKGIKLIKNSNSIMVSGSEANIQKVKEMISSLDQATPQAETKISQVGTTTFLTYKPKSKSAKELLDQLKSTTKDLKQEDPQLVQTINSAKTIDGTLVFSGSQENLEKISKLLDSYDLAIPGIAPKKPFDKYQNYKPVYKPGAELIKELQNYMDIISNKGVDDSGLTTTIQNLQLVNGRIVIVGNQANIDQVLQLLQEFDTPTQDLSKPSTTIESFDNISFLNYKLNFHSGNEIQVALKQIGEELQLSKSPKNESLINAISSVQWIKVTNSLIATGDAQTLARLKEIMESIDIPLKQVFIEVLVIETNTTNNLDIGLRWGGYSNFKGRFAGAASSYPRVDATNGLNLQNKVKGNATSAGTSSSGVNAVNGPSPNLFDSVSAGQLGIIGDIIFHGGRSYLTLSSLLTALQEEGRVTITLNQKIMAQDSRMSQIFVGSNIPFTGSIITTSGISQTTNANLEYRNIGVSLNITPNIGDNGIVTLEIDEEITEEQNLGTQTSTVNTQQVNGIRTSKTSMQTRVHVPDKAFVVLSGQIRNTKTKTKSGLPCLGGLPVIGAAFQQSTTADVNNDVIIFIRPEIIQTAEQWKEVSEQQEDIYRTQNDTETFDQSIELVKKED